MFNTKEMESFTNSWVSTCHHLANPPCLGTGWAGNKQYNVLENQLAVKLADTTASSARTTAILLQWAQAFLVNWLCLLRGYQTISQLFILNVVCSAISSPMSVVMPCTNVSPQPCGNRAGTAVKISGTKDCFTVNHTRNLVEGM
jgi:hypothetical protein